MDCAKGVPQVCHNEALVVAHPSGSTNSNPLMFKRKGCARVAELVDALDLGSKMDLKDTTGYLEVCHRWVRKWGNSPHSYTNQVVLIVYPCSST
jgi:hypothetical protein